MKQFKGTGVALATPFGADKQIDFGAYGKLIESVIKGGVEYLVVNGTTGESATLTKEEKIQALEFAVSAAKGRVPVVAGVGGNNTSGIVSFLKSFHFRGIAGILSVSPYYNKPIQAGIYQHYLAVAEASPLPVILYNVPGRTGSNLTAETTLRLAGAHRNIIGVKEASGNMEQCMQIIQHRPEGFLVLSGDDALTLPFVACGMDGVISVTANALPADFSEMVRLALAGKFSRARELHYRMLDIMTLLFADGSPGGVKFVLSRLGICHNELRLPLVPVGKATADKLSEKLAAYPFRKGVGSV